MELTNYLLYLITHGELMFEVRFYRDAAGRTPFGNWLDSLDEEARNRADAAIIRLSERGNQLRRPEADYLRDGIYELRWHIRRVQYRILYFFHGRQVVIISHGLTKLDRIPEKEIELAIRRKKVIQNQRE